MDAESDEDDYVFYGTPLQDEQEGEGKTGGQHLAAKDPSQLRSLPVHKQEVVDEQGRRRFHGAFTGGYSAGYFNTVGSKVSSKRACATLCCVLASKHCNLQVWLW